MVLEQHKPSERSATGGRALTRGFHSGAGGNTSSMVGNGGLAACQQVDDTRIDHLVVGEAALAAQRQHAARHEAGQVGGDSALGEPDMGDALGAGALVSHAELQERQARRVPERAEEFGQQLPPGRICGYHDVVDSDLRGGDHGTDQYRRTPQVRASRSVRIRVCRRGA